MPKNKDQNELIKSYNKCNLNQTVAFQFSENHVKKDESGH